MRTTAEISFTFLTALVIASVHTHAFVNQPGTKKIHSLPSSSIIPNQQQIYQQQEHLKQNQYRCHYWSSRFSRSQPIFAKKKTSEDDKKVNKAKESSKDNSPSPPPKEEPKSSTPVPEQATPPPPSTTTEIGTASTEYSRPNPINLSTMKDNSPFVTSSSQITRNSNTRAAELLQNRGRVPTSQYMPPQGEAWKEGIFPKDPPQLITIDPFDILIQLRSEMGWFFRDILQEATDYNARLLPPEHFTAAFKRAYDEVNSENPCFGVRDGLTSREWWLKVTKLTYGYADITEPGLQEDLDDWLLEDVFDVLYHDVFMTDEAWEIKPGAVEALSYFKKWRDEQGELLPVGNINGNNAGTSSSITRTNANGPNALCILTNFDERMHAILDELDILDAFDAVLTSREIGSSLPERSAYQVAMARFGISDPKYCMHISARFDKGVVGASETGWHPIYIPVTGEQDVPPGTDPNLVFSMMGNLFGVLHVWDREPENRLIDTTVPVYENGVFGFHEKIWDDTEEDDTTSDEDKKDAMYLPPSDRTKSWEGPGRF